MHFRTNRAITMVEILVASALLSIVAFVASSILTSTIQQSESAKKKGEIAMDTATLRQQLMTTLSLATSIDTGAGMNECGNGTTIYTIGDGHANCDPACNTTANPLMHFTVENAFSYSQASETKQDLYLFFSAPQDGPPGSPGELQIQFGAGPFSGKGLFLENIAEFKCRYTDTTIAPASGESGQGADSIRFWITTKKKTDPNDATESWTDLTKGTNRQVVLEFSMRNRVKGPGGITNGNSGIRYAGGSVYFFKPGTL